MDSNTLELLKHVGTLAAPLAGVFGGWLISAAAARRKAKDKRGRRLGAAVSALLELRHAVVGMMVLHRLVDKLAVTTPAGRLQIGRWAPLETSVA